MHPPYTYRTDASNTCVYKCGIGSSPVHHLGHTNASTEFAWGWAGGSTGCEGGAAGGGGSEVVKIPFTNLQTLNINSKWHSFIVGRHGYAFFYTAKASLYSTLCIYLKKKKLLI